LHSWSQAQKKGGGANHILIDFSGRRKTSYYLNIIMLTFLFYSTVSVHTTMAGVGSLLLPRKLSEPMIGAESFG
ncbi:unnamed protein product, partial [Urochloa humidicola]